MKEHTPSKKPIFYYAIIAMIALLLLNAFVFPSLLQNEVKEVGYNEFLTMIDSNKVKEVSRDEATQTITFTSEQAGKTLYYKTGIWPDDTLVSRLNKAGIAFSASIPTQTSPLTSFLFSWMLPILIFVGLGQFLMKRMQNGMPGGIGNALSFGKANAKIYVEAQTGKTFGDVAGQDEAK